MRRSTAIVLAASAVLATLVGAGSAAATPPDEDPRVAEHRRIVASWTPEARAAAIDRSVLLRDAPRELRKPGTGGGGTTTGTVTGASWGNLEANVARVTGKVFFREGGVAYVCSGAAVAAGDVDLVLTAGHCLHGGSGSDEGFVTDFEFVPNYGKDPNGPAWTATDLFTTDDWTTGTTTNGPGSKWNDDAGFAAVFNADDLQLSSLGTLPSVQLGQQPTSAAQASFGYPAGRPYNGKVLTYCLGTTRLDRDSNDTYALACNMTGGSSGGPWLTGFDPTTGTGGAITSLNSYGYASLKNVMFGPIFDEDEGAVRDAALDGDCDAATEAVPCIDYDVEV